MNRLKSIEITAGIQNFRSIWQATLLATRRSRVSIQDGSSFALDHFKKLRYSVIKCQGKDNSISIGGELVGCTINIIGDGNEVSIGSNCRLTFTEITIISNNSSIRLSENSTSNGKHHAPNLLLARGEASHIFIGEDCMLAYGIEVRTSDSHPIFAHNGERINPSADVTLGKHVWVGAYCSILKGSHIGPGSILSTRSLVTSEVGSNEIWGGVPAKLIRRGVTWIR